ncbi:MAG: DUF1570 domain-containing protein [Planctomycetota bacterium]
MGSPREVLLGRIAVKRGLLSPEELTRAIEEQTRRGDVTLGVLLVQLGLLSQLQLNDLLAEQQAALSAQAPAAPPAPPGAPAKPVTQGQNLLGRRAVDAGLLTPDQLNDCIREQGLREGQGRFQRLGEILVDKGLLTATQVEALIGAQGKRLLKCPKCHAQYNVAGDSGPSPACPRCRVALVVAAATAPPPDPFATAATIVRTPSKPKLDNVSAEGTIYFNKETVELPSVDPGPRRSPPPPPARRPGGGTTRRTKKHAPKPKYVDYRKSRTARPPSFQWVGFAAIGAAVLLVGILALGGSSKPPSTTSSSSAEPEKPTTSSSDPRVVSDEQWRSYLAGLPEDPVERIRRLDGMDFSGPMGKRAKKEIARIEEELDRKLDEEFRQRRKSASDLAASEQYDAAISAWNDFPRRLDVHGKYADRIAAEVSTLQKRSEAHDVAVRPRQPVEPAQPRTSPEIDAANQRVAQARADIARRKKEVADLKLAEFARLTKGSVSRPMDLDINGQLLKGCVFTEINDDGGLIKVKDPPVTTSLFFAYLKPPTLFKIRKAMTDAEEVSSRFALGRYAARLGLYKEAEQEFKWVVGKDASYQSRVPDLAKLKQRGIVFHGVVQSRFDKYKIVYDFTGPDEALDFQTDVGNVSVEKGQLVLAGSRVVQASLKEVAFAGEATLSVAMAAAPQDMLIGWGLQLTCTDGKAVSLLVFSVEGELIVMAKTPGADKMDEKATLPARGGEELSFKLEKGTQISLLQGKTVLWSDSVPTVTACGISLLGFHRQETGTVRGAFDKISMEGKIRPEWMKKMRAESEVRALRTLEEDLQLSSDDEADPPLDPLSVEANARISSSDLGLFREARQTLERRGLTYKEVYEVELKLYELAQREPGFPGTPYILARLLSRIGVDDMADELLSRAVELDPRFYEALVERAKLSVDKKEFDKAKKDIEAALAIKPDCGQAWSARGYIRISERKFLEAAEDLELAIALTPTDRGALHLLKDARHLLKGPWPKESGKTEYVAETQHFRVRTDMGAKKAKEFAERLEKAREVYVLEIPPPSGAVERAEVVVFYTEEAYHTYAELTSDDRAESTLGYFHPLYNQLFLFEGATDVSGQELLHVLFHEGFHQYLEGIIPFNPTWCNEGLAEYYGGKAFARETGLTRDPFLAIRLENLQSSYAAGSKIDFATIMDMSQAEFYGDWAPVLYAQGWAMCHWFLEVAPKGEREAFLAYLDEMRRGSTREEARERAFAGKDLKDMERRWSSWMRAWKY